MTFVLGELNVTLLAAVVGVIVVLGFVSLVAVAHRRDSQDATGFLSPETLKADTSSKSPASATVSSDTASVASVPVSELESESELVLAGGSPVVSAPPRSSDLDVFVSPDPEALGVTRRQFFNRSIVAFFGFALLAFGTEVIAFLWPTSKGGFGSKITVGSLTDVKQKITAGTGFYYVSEGRLWMTDYPASSLDKAKAVYPPAIYKGMTEGANALYQKCPHLGCRIPSCVSSQWFECPCHGSQFNQVGEKKGGPAPRGMDRFAIELTNGVVSIDTGTVFQGPPVGTNTTGQEAEGPHCVGGGH